MTEFETERLKMLERMNSQIGECKHLLRIIAESQEGARQQQSVATDSMHGELRQVKTMLASLQHDINELPK